MKYRLMVMALVAGLVVGLTLVQDLNTVDRTVMVLMDGGSSGSGVWVADDRVLTARHVAEHALKLAVRLPDGTVYPVSGVELCENADLALLVVLTPQRERRIAYGKARLGVRVQHIGAPLGLWPTVTEGIVSGLDRDNSLGEDLIQVDASGIGPGSSGGPVFDWRGRLIGIVVGGPGPGFAMAIPAEQIRGFLDDLGIER